MNDQIETNIIKSPIPQEFLNILANSIGSDTAVIKRVTVDKIAELIMNGYTTLEISDYLGVGEYALVKELADTNILDLLGTKVRLNIVDTLKKASKEGIELKDYKILDSLIHRQIEVANGFSPIKSKEKDDVPEMDIVFLTEGTKPEKDYSVSLAKNPNGFIEGNVEPKNNSESNVDSELSDMINWEDDLSQL